MFRIGLFLVIICTAASLAGIVAGMVLGQPILTLLSAFAVILFMWVGFMLKAIQQRNQGHD
ncbi:hypothetical protein [Sporolactobacillus inulinus]|uniref:Uncharacterized protein n=2 Tax=Sporolactobacillus inulinus TaxID=2078 RepID=A0A4Y1ZBG8_9BACL|nr:hypothetical protein [Sporolactobacillus inulinus]KLI02777.1 hypothetical protein SINU_06220 [Sporolactobacillus inulinus CASD]GAY76422.1 hypothetical protein NBRC111894_1976 [Sporolactobacillus inulinus]GEB77552.1 hypothetical protein SIN01_18970 [Sporolactobacillus inulinus]